VVPVEKISLYELPEEKLSNKVSRRTAVGKNMSVAKYLLKKGSTAPIHHHSVEQATLIIQGRLSLIIEEREMVLQAGDLIFIPPNTPHGGGEALEDVVSLDFFSPPREDIQNGTDPLKKWSVVGR
jgi:quercetin dioxygenase-like cupin family protein